MEHSKLPTPPLSPASTLAQAHPCQPHSMDSEAVDHIFLRPVKAYHFQIQWPQPLPTPVYLVAGPLSTTGSFGLEGIQQLCQELVDKPVFPPPLTVAEIEALELMVMEHQQATNCNAVTPDSCTSTEMPALPALTSCTEPLVPVKSVKTAPKVKHPLPCYLAATASSQSRAVTTTLQNKKGRPSRT